MNLRCTSSILGTPVTVALLGVGLIGVGRLPVSALDQINKYIRTGVVRSSEGSPLDQVWVERLGAGSSNGSVTKADGLFQFPTGKHTLLFYRDGYRPEVRVVSGSQDSGDLSVILQPEPKAALTLRLCGRKGVPIRELEPAGVHGLHVKRSHDVDFVSYDAAYSYGGSEWYLSSMTGVHVGGMIPRPEWARELSSFTVRTLKCGDYQWYDLRGISPQGLESRWLGSVGYVEYSNVPPPVARVFDKAIDHGCCR
jgi:hypothetical protein